MVAWHYRAEAPSAGSSTAIVSTAVPVLSVGSRIQGVECRHGGRREDGVVEGLVPWPEVARVGHRRWVQLQVTATFVTLALGTTPLPFVTVQVWPGDFGCVFTVTA
jgi:hypothetical protein